MTRRSENDCRHRNRCRRKLYTLVLLQLLETLDRLIPEIAEVRLARPRPNAEIENFILLQVVKLLLCRNRIDLINEEAGAGWL